MKLRAHMLIGSVLAALAWTGGLAMAQDEALSETPAPLTEKAPGEDSTGSALEAYWEHRLANAKQRLALAREQAEQAEAEYSRARHDRNPRGSALDAIKQKQLAAEREAKDAEEALPQLVEQARRAGVSAAVLRDYWDEES